MFESYRNTMINVKEEKNGIRVTYRAIAQGDGIREDYVDETEDSAREGVKNKVDRTIERIEHNRKNK